MAKAWRHHQCLMASLGGCGVSASIFSKQAYQCGAAARNTNISSLSASWRRNTWRGVMAWRIYNKPIINVVTS